MFVCIYVSIGFYSILVNYFSAICSVVFRHGKCISPKVVSHAILAVKLHFWHVGALVTMDTKRKPLFLATSMHE